MDARDKELQRQRAEIKRLRRSQEELTAKFAALKRDTGDGVLQALDRLRANAVSQSSQLSTLAAVADAQRVSSVVASAQTSAYGQRGSVFAKNNLILAGNQLFWSFLEPMLRSAGVTTLSPAMTAWIGAAGAFAVGQVALAGEQHVRFVSGVVKFDGKVATMRQSLRGDIADRYWPIFQRRTNVPVAVTPLDAGMGSLIGSASGGILSIGPLDDDEPPIGRAAWLLDTGVDVG